MALQEYAVVNGLNVPNFVVQEEVDKLKHFQLYPDDVWVVTYPKCGTAWMQQLPFKRTACTTYSMHKQDTVVSGRLVSVR